MRDRRLLLLLVPLLLLLLLWWAGTGSTVLRVASGSAGSSARILDQKVGLAASLDLGQPPVLYQADTLLHGSGWLGWLARAQALRPSLAWQDRGAGLAEVSGVDLAGGGVATGLVYAGLDGRQYLLLLQPDDRSVAWWSLVNGKPAEQLASATYTPNFLLALQTLLGEVALVGLYACLLLLLVLLVGGLLRLAGAGSWSLAAKPQWQQWAWLVPLLIFAVALLATGYVAYNVLEAVPHVQDGAAYLFQSRIFAEGRLRVPDPGLPLHAALDHAYVLFYDGAWFSKYPPGYPLVLAVGTLLGQPAIVDPFCTAAALVFVYLSGKSLVGVRVGLLATGLGLTSPFLLTMSGSFLSHSLGLLCTAAFLYFFIQATHLGAGTVIDQPTTLQGGRRAWPRLQPALYPLLAGLSIGWLAITRELTAVGVAAPFVVYAVADLLRQRDGLTLRRYLLMVAGALPPIIFLLLDNRVLTGGFLTFPHDLQGDFDKLGFGPGIGGTAGGHTPALGLVNAATYLRTLAEVLFGWPAPFTFSFALLGLCLPPLASRASRSQCSLVRPEILLFAPILSLASGYYFWWAAARVFGPRYWYEMLPFLCILTALGVCKLAALFPAQRGRGTAWAAGLLLALLISYNLSGYLPTYLEGYRGYNDLSGLARDTVQRAGLRRAIVFVTLDRDAPRKDYSKVFWLNDPLLNKGGDAVIYLRDLGDEQNQAAARALPGWPSYRLDGDRLTAITR